MRVRHNMTPTGLVLFAMLACCLAVPNARADYFTNTAAMATMRQGHAGVLLPNGKALVAGGYNNTFAITEGAELYDATNRVWTAAASMAFKRAAFRLTRLQDGSVLASGGLSVFNSIYATHAEVYDAATGQWTTKGALNIPRHSHTATLLSDGRVLIAGGDATNGYPASAELYNPTTGDWTLTGALTPGRDSHTATLLPTGKVLVAGGHNAGRLSSVLLYDPASGSWAAANPLPATREFHTATLLLSGKVLVVGGVGNWGVVTSALLYDATNGTWTATGSLHQERYNHKATLLPGGKVLVAGGYDDSNIALSTAELYDPGTGLWTMTASMNAARIYPAAVALSDEQVLFAGGTGAGGFLDILSSAELFVTTATPAAPIILTHPTMLETGSFQFTFTNAPGTSFTVLASTNVSLPLNNWTELGSATEVTPGQVQFSDSSTVEHPQRFYHVSSP